MLEQFRLSQQRQFGQSSESNLNQNELFDEAEQTLDELVDNPPEKAVSGDARQTPKRQLLPKDLPRDIIVHDIPDSEKTCTDCGHDR